MPRNPRLLLLPAVVAGAIALATAVPAGADSSGCPARDPISNTAGACATDEEPVESIDPAWSARFVPPAPSTFRAAATTLCLPVDAVFYAQTDWLRLAQKLRLNPSSCAEYYVSVPPLAADKTKLRAGEAAKIRALASSALYSSRMMSSLNLASNGTSLLICFHWRSTADSTVAGSPR